MEPFLLLSIHQSAVRTVVSFHSSVTLCNLIFFSLAFALTSAGSVGMLPHTVIWIWLWVKTQWKLGREQSVSVSSQYIMLTSLWAIKVLKSKSARTHKINKEKQEGCHRVPISHFSFSHDIFIHVRGRGIVIVPEGQFLHPAENHWNYTKHTINKCWIHWHKRQTSVVVSFTYTWNFPIVRQ